MFDKVRVMDREFSRLETFVSSLEWTQELLLELIERRLNVPLISKFPLHGPTWDAYFEHTASGSSQEMVFSFCQYRPRDVLTYCSYAIQAAQSKLHERILVEDLLVARRVFSDNRLKDLGDEYADNYPQLQLVISRFYGLGREFTINGLADFIKKLLVDEEVKQYCKTWIYNFVSPDLFVKLMYGIGFFGIKDDEHVVFRTVGSQSAILPPISAKTVVVIHPTYADALNLQDMTVNSLSENVDLKQAGLIGDLPGASLEEYQKTLGELRESLATLPMEQPQSAAFEDLIGETLRLCFFRALTNVEAKVRSIDNRVIRDWVAANHSSGGFWELVRQKYGAVQIVWECKNYADLSADDFHQAAYYMTNAGGRFVVIAYRGQEKKKSYYEHVKRVSSENGGFILLVDGRDLDIIVRRTINGKSIQPHMQELFDRTVRKSLRLGGWPTQAVFWLEWGFVAGPSLPAALSRFRAPHSHSISTLPAQPVAYWRKLLHSQSSARSHRPRFTGF